MVKAGSLQGLFQVERETFSDERGFFREPLRLGELEKAIGQPFKIAQMNHARSVKNTLRGIHAAPWNKLIYVVRGKIQSVIVDLRPDSPTFGKHEMFTLGDQNRVSIYIPAGCGNSYLSLSDEVDYVYLTDQEYEPNKEIGVAWNDPDLAIKWEISGEPLLSEKDKQNPSFASLFPNKF